MEINRYVTRLRDNKDKSIISFIGCAYVMNNEDCSDFSKLKWYVTTAYSLLEEDFELSDDELREFLNLHLKYIIKINKERIMIPLEGLLNRAELLDNLKLN